MTVGEPSKKQWGIERLTGTAGRFHARELPAPVERLVSVLEVTRPALVLGSAQPETDVDAIALSRHDVELVRRRSGGGAVLLVPGETVWVDVVLPRGDALWCDDVGKAFHWLGEVWIEALAKLGINGVSHEGPLICSPWSRRICFAGLGAGEVLVDGRKVVGISQRRQRSGVRFQCAILRRWDPETVVNLMSMNNTERAEAMAALQPVATGIGATPNEITEALLSSLPG